MMPQPTDVVILGGTGFIGRRLVEHLRNAGSGEAPNWIREVTPLSSQDCNLLDARQSAEQLARVTGSTTLIVCSGISRLAGDSWSLFQTNVTMVRNLLGAIDHVVPRAIVFLSSVDVYGLPATELPITEATLPQPTTYYGLAKLACERMLALAPFKKCPVACLRLPGIYGASDGGRSVVGRFCRRLRAGQGIQLSGEGRVARDFVYVDDLCALIEVIIAAPVDVTLNVATGTSMPVRVIAETVASRLQLPEVKRDALFESSPPNSDRDYDLQFDPRRLHAFAPQVAFRGIAAGIESYFQELEQAR